MEYSLIEIASKLTTVGLSTFKLSMQYFPTKKALGDKKYLPSSERVKTATGAANVTVDINGDRKDWSGNGIIAEECERFPETIGESVAMALYVHIPNAGDIAIFPGNPEAEILKEPSYCWQSKRGKPDVRSRVDRVLKNDFHWRKADALFYHTMDL